MQTETSTTVAELALGPARDTLRRVRAWAESNVAPATPELTWTTPNEVVLEHPRMQLRRFAGEGQGTPLLLVAPEVNGATITDYGPGQSLVQAALDHGFPAVYVVHWRSSHEGIKDGTIADSVRSIEAALDHLGEPVHLAGICQGGWESALVVARHPERVLSLTLIAAAIDFRAGDGPLPGMVDALPQRAYEAMVALGGGTMRGELLNQGFDLLQAWDRMVVGPLRDWNRAFDGRYRERQDRLSRWYDSRKDLAGPMYLSVVDDLFRNNRLIKGELVLDGETEPVDLARITCPLALVAGTRDHITPPEQVWALEDAGSSTEVRRWAFDAGHVGVSIGGRVLREGWPEIFAWLRGFDPPAPEAAPAPKKSAAPKKAAPKKPASKKRSGGSKATD